MSERLSPHFTLLELTTTQVRGIDNTPGPEHVKNLRRLCHSVLEPVRRRFGPFYVSSGYRSPAVNKIIGGSPTSAHPDGRAADGAPTTPAVKWKDVIAFVLDEDNGIPIDQVIYEYGRWLHLGIAADGAKPRRQALMIFEPGKYERWNPTDLRVGR